MSFKELLEKIKQHKIKEILFHIIMYQIKDFSFLIDGKSFFDLPVKNVEAYEKKYWHEQ